MAIPYFKKYLFLIVCIAVILLFGRNLNPFDTTTFIVHDETQPARILEFVFNLQHNGYPPRIAPHMSFGLGYPIFNFYAPAAYWITSLLYIGGLNVASALELSYLLALLTAYIGMYLLLKRYFNEYVSILGALAYISSPFVAVDIFVRGNLAEIWFFALFPLSLFVITTTSSRTLPISAVVLALLFTSHNIFSLVSVPLLIGFAFLQKQKRIPLFSISAGLLLSSYFLIPALTELDQVQASSIATITDYTKHFLCPAQLWYSPWGFGGSVAGCQFDGMSFMVGKLQILMGFTGLGYFGYQIIKKRTISNYRTMVAFSLLFVGSLLMTTHFSTPIWKTFESLLSIFQFPWRFLLFVIFGLSFFGAYAVTAIPKKWQFPSIVLLIIMYFILNPKFFEGNTLSTEKYLNQYASDGYIRNTAAFKVAEYLPQSADYDYWRSLEESGLDSLGPIAKQAGQDVQILRNDPFEKIALVKSSQDVALNIHYAPYWIIHREGTRLFPDTFDELGRPVVDVSSAEHETVTITYRQTLIQQLANGITVAAGIILLIYSGTYQRWHKKKI